MPDLYPDGLYHSTDLEQAINKDAFTSEKDLCDFIEQNIIDFTSEIGFKYKSHIREYSLKPSRRYQRGKKRLDFLISSDCGKVILIECKKPTYKCELSAAIGQILSYIEFFEKHIGPIDKFILLSTVLDADVTFIIERFNLPIEFIIMDKTKTLTWHAQRKN